MIAMVFEMLRQRDGVGSVCAEVNVVSCDTDRIRTKSRHHTRSRRVANGLLAIGMREP